MDIRIDVEGPGRISAHLRDGLAETTVTAANTAVAAAALVGALERAKADGEADCYWHEPVGQYWWLMRCEGASLEIAVMWSHGAVTGWQHVFRATDEVHHVITRVREELANHGIDVPAA